MHRIPYALVVCLGAALLLPAEEATSPKIKISPNPVTLAAGAAQQFTAVVTGDPTNSVAWFAGGQLGGNAGAGYITQTGLYVAPLTAPAAPVYITAISKVLAQAGGVAVVTITPGAGGTGVSISPSGATVQTGATQQFTASAGGAAVTWSVNGSAGGNATVGTISATGLYTAPAAIPSPATVTVQATAATSPPSTATASVTVTTPPNPQPTVTNVTPASIPAGPFSIAIAGTGFTPQSTVSFGGAPLQVSYISSTQLAASGLVTAAQVGPVSVVATSPNAPASLPYVVQVVAQAGVVSPTAAARFLEQAAFGPSPASLQQVVQNGFQPWLTTQFGLGGSNYQKAGGGYVTSFSTRFVTNAVMQPDQLRQRTAFALSQIYVVSLNKLNFTSNLGPYLEMLSQNAFGNVYSLLRTVTLSPQMGWFLDMVNNDKANPALGTLPNENYARELMQLFSIGTVLLNPDGTPQSNAQGPIPAYTQKDVTEIARALTGWTYAPAPGQALLGLNNRQNMGAPMTAWEPAHDSGAKTLFAGTPLQKNILAGQTAAQDLDDVLTTLFNHPNAAPFFSRRLIQHLVTSNPSPGYVQRVAAVFANNGQGVRGDLKAVLTAILLDSEARAGDQGAAPSASGHLQEPALFLSGLLRAFNATVDDTNYFSFDLTNMLQPIGAAPSVFNFYSPGFRPQGAGQEGPEFQIYTQATALWRANVVASLFSAYANPIQSYGPGTTLDLTAYVNLAANPSNLVNALDGALTCGQLPAAVKSVIVNAISGPMDNVTRTQTAIYLIVESGFYQVWH